MYLQKAAEALKALEGQEEDIRAAAGLVAQAVKEDRLVHLFGTEARATGIIADVFFQPGFPTHLDPMTDPTLDFAHGAYRNRMAVEVDNLAPCILDYYERVQEGDPIILIGSDASSKMFAQSLAWAKAKKLKVITVSNSCVEADVCVEIDPSYFMITAAAVLNKILKEIDLPEDLKWTGDRIVDLEKNEQKINNMLFRIRHL